MMPNQPSGWLVYAEVASVKKTMAKAEKAGAKAVVPFQPIGEMGAIGVFVDPQGSPFGIWEKAAPKPKAKKAAKKAAAKKAKRR
jgi:predicted enzyme related to lactoylglutathione lyase